MKTKLFILSCLILFGLTKLYSQNFDSYESLYKAFTTMEADPNAVVQVNSLFLMRDIGSFSLDSGKIYFLKPIGGRIIGAVFLGKGTFSFTPPLYCEKTQLERYYKQTSINRTFTSLGIIFGDDTYNQIKNDNTIAPGLVDPKVKDVISSIITYTSSKKYEIISDDFGFTFLNNKKNNLFYSIMEDEGAPNMWGISPFDQEEISFGRGRYFTGVGDYEENICKFNQEKFYTDSIKVKKESITYVITDYDLKCNLVSNSNMINAASMNIAIKDSNIKWICFNLEPNFNIDSIKLSTGLKLNYFAPDETGLIWVCLDKVYQKDEKLTLVLSYSGTFLRKYADYSLLSSSTGWYPRNPYNYKDLANFHNKFETSKFLKFISIGKKLSETVDGDVRTSEFVTEYPIRNASFMIGAFDEKHIKTEDLPPISLYYLNSDQSKAVLGDLENSFRFYQTFFGKIRVKEFNATELYGGHGEAFPGMLHLSSSAFVSGSKTGEWEQFVSHETAHQWWGIEVDFESYRDQWLSEAFAEYSSLMYTQTAMKDNDKFFKMLDNMKKTLLYIKAGKSEFGKARSGMEGGAISLGYRNGGDYQTIVYSKGAWVLHMLRNMLLDFSKMNDDKFMNILKEVFVTYQTKNATTEGFQKIVEKYIGTDMTWFFNEWVNGNKIPKYTFGYTTEMTPEGKCKVKCRIKQEDTGDDFSMIVPIKIDFGENRFYPMRLNIKGKMTEIELPLLPMKPKNIQFNALESVLCEYDTEDYEDIK